MTAALAKDNSRNDGGQMKVNYRSMYDGMAQTHGPAAAAAAAQLTRAGAFYRRAR